MPACDVADSAGHLHPGDRCSARTAPGLRWLRRLRRRLRRHHPDAWALPRETTCGDATCAEGVATLPSTCNGIGACAVAETEGCEPYRCGDDACMESCTSEGDCLTGFTCEDGACVVKGSTPNPDDDLGGLAAVGGGCGCGSAGGQTENGALWLAGALAILLAARRQRRVRATIGR